MVVGEAPLKAGATTKINSNTRGQWRAGYI